MDWTARFVAFVEQKTAAAEAARIPGYVTTASHGAQLGLPSITDAWASRLFDGPFFESGASNPGLPAVNTVFVQSADGNTGADNPMDLGGGLTDKHLIYEGLSSVHADAIFTGAETIRGAQMVMAIWRPELVQLRIYLTTSPKPGGEPNTPFYTGTQPLNTTLVVRKAGRDEETGVWFEHLQLAD
jgi:hypothetical protein